MTCNEILWGFRGCGVFFRPLPFDLLSLCFTFTIETLILFVFMLLRNFIDNDRINNRIVCLFVDFFKPNIKKQGETFVCVFCIQCTCSGKAI